MPGLLQIAFYQYFVVAEAAGRFALARSQGLGKGGASLDDTHTFSATTRAGLDEHRIANCIGLLLQEGGSLVVAMVARDQRNTCIFHTCTGSRVTAQCTDAAIWRANDEYERAGEGRDKPLVPGKKTENQRE